MRNQFSVYYRLSGSLESSEFARFDSLEEAVSLALALHRSSNVPHLVSVDDNAHSRTELTFKTACNEE